MTWRSRSWSHRGQDPALVRRLEQEAQIIGALSHANILAVYDFGTHDGALDVVSELLEGETLRARLDAVSLPLARAIDVAVQIASGLAAAHEKGIVHRDLKPENLFLTRDGCVKILDFGLAKLMSPRISRQRPRCRRRPRRPTRHARHGGLHVAGAGARCAGRSPRGHFCVRCRSLRAADRPARVSPRLRG